MLFAVVVAVVVGGGVVCRRHNGSHIGLLCLLRGFIDVVFDGELDVVVIVVGSLMLLLLSLLFITVPYHW